MPAVTTPDNPRPIAGDPGTLWVRRTGVSADTAAVAGLVVWFLVLVALSWGTWGDFGRDGGFDLLAAHRTAGGELPFVDYTYYYGPLTPLLLGGLYAALGTSLELAFAFGLLLSAVIVGQTFVLARRIAGTGAATLAAALAATAALASGNNSFVMPHSVSAPLAVALSLAALLALQSHAVSGRRNLLVAAGFAAGLAAVTRPEAAAALGVLLVAWAAVRLLDAPAGRRQALREAVALLAPAVALALLTYGAFAIAVGPRDLLLDNLYPETIREGGKVILEGNAPLTLESFATLGGRLVLYALGTVALAVAGTAIARSRRAQQAAMVLTVLAAIGLVATVAVRPETVRYYLQFVYGWLPAGAAAAAIVLAVRERRRGALWTAGVQGPLLVALLLALVAVTGYGAFYPHPRPDAPQASAYAMPLVAIFLAWLHMRAAPRGQPAAAAVGAAWLALLVIASAGLVIGDAREETVRVNADRGSFSAPPADGPALQRAVTAIERFTEPGEPILVAPQLTALYVVTGREDPLPELSLLPGSLATAADEDRAIERMAAVRLAIVDRRRLALYGHGAFGETFDRRLGAWLEQNFERTQTLRGIGDDPRILDVWTRP